MVLQQLVNGIEAEVRLILINEVMADKMPTICNTIFDSSQLIVKHYAVANKCAQAWDITLAEWTLGRNYKLND